MIWGLEVVQSCDIGLKVSDSIFLRCISIKQTSCIFFELPCQHLILMNLISKPFADATKLSIDWKGQWGTDRSHCYLLQ